jgi:ribosome-associated heat shock protein Hsp15
LVGRAPASAPGEGDRIEVTTGHVRRTVEVRGLSERRGPASEAVRLYEETPESVARRAREAEQRRLAPSPGADAGARPTKRDRRRIDAARGKRR